MTGALLVVALYVATGILVQTTATIAGFSLLKEIIFFSLNFYPGQYKQIDKETDMMNYKEVALEKKIFSSLVFNIILPLFFPVQNLNCVAPCPLLPPYPILLQNFSPTIYEISTTTVIYEAHWKRNYVIYY